MSTIRKLGKLKSANKGQMTKLETKFESVLTELAAMSLTSSEGRDKIATLQSCVSNIENKIAYLKDIDDKIVDLAEEDEIENMVCDFDDYYNDKNDVLQKFKNKFNQMLNASTESAVTVYSYLSPDLRGKDGKQLLYVDKENDQPESEKRRIVVFTEQEKQIIFNDVHASSRGAHYGVNVTVRKITDRFYWLGVKADVQRWIKSCDACQRSEKLKTVAPELKSIKVEGAWKMLGIDLIGPLQVTSSGNNYILTITDYWTKFVQAFPIPAKSADHVEFHIDQYQVTEEMMAERVNVMSAIKTKVDQNISKAQARQKKYYQQKKSKGYKCFDFRVGMSVLSRNNRKVGRKGHRMENDWLGPYVICKLSNGCVELTNNGQPLKSKVSISNIKPYLIDSKEKSVNVIDNTVTMDSPSKRITLNGANNDDTKVQSNRKLLVIKKDLSKEHETGEPKNVGSVRTKVKRKLLLIKQNAAFVSSLNNGKCEATGRVNTATEVRTVSSDSVPKMVSILNKTLISDGSTKPQIKDGLDIKPSAGKQAIPVRMDCKETGVGYEDDACTTSVDELVGDPDFVIVENENLACEPRVSRRKKGKESGRGSDVKDLVQASTISGDFYKRLPLAGKRRIFKILDSPTDWLDDNVIDAAQSLLSVQFNSLAGFQAACSLCEPKFGGYMPSDSSSFVQIVNVNRNHWSVVSNLSSEAGSQGKVVQYYDSLLVGANKRCVPFSVCQVAASTLFCQSSEKITVDVMDCQKQSGGNDCGLFAVAHATALCFGMDPSLFQWKQDQMRSHLKKCISSGRIEMFPHTYQNVHKKVILFSFDFDIYCHCRKPYDKKMFRCQLIGDAAKVIDGLPLTELNYEHALQILENRYGKKQQLVAAYMKGLWELPSPNFSIKSLQYFHDKLETYVRGLQSLGKNEDHYGELLVPIILEKLPNQTRKTISREHGNEEWNLPTLRKLILKEIEIMQAGEITETIQRDYTEFNQATAAFQTNVKKYTVYTQSCVFCKGKHSSNKCHAISSPEKRYEIVVRERLCFNCLGKHHIKYCKSKYNCQHCNKKHHSAICRNIKHQPQEDKSNEITSNVTNQHDTDSLTTHAHLATNYVPHKISKSSVILKTATAKISSPITTIETVILFDEGATRTFITEETVKKLNLKPTHAEVIHLSIFGDNSPRSKKLNVVLFNLETKYGPNLQIKAMVVPQISTPMKVMTQQVKELPHIKHLDLAQHITADDVEISLLIGADYYWDIIGDHVVKGPGPTAVSSSLGYVLSGPFQTESFSKRTFVQSYLIIDQTNDYLSKFWDLDSIGIKEHDMHSQQSNDLKIFENKYIEKNENKYISSLPWKNDHSPLPSNYLPTVNRTRKMIRKLSTDNVKLYNQIILDYEKRKFIEKVDNENVHEGHYLPHRAVHKESLTTPIRIVFDCSYKTQDNPSLNDCLQKEPRLHNAPMNDSSKFPILLPKQSKLCKLKILNAHERVKHFGLHATVNYLRQRFWIAKIRVSVKSVINKCVICKRVNGFPYRNMLNAPLPSCRLEKSPPFTVTGVDFTGEMYVKTNTEEHKCYVCLFTCANTRAIHLELISDMSTQTFLRAFRRFAARRSIPKIMISDNASTFQFANGELQNLIENADIKHYMCNQHLIWKFIPKRAAWYGGFWERLIGITKTTLKKILGRAFITYDELQTVLCEVEATLNDRPITYLNVQFNLFHFIFNSFNSICFI
ncbi:Gypsy retrotransposon integrase-like protein 1 [Nymphon striatum]|nr:Gypsy retrotransposon integrase-like protein 1 [Nymphon striatum]